MEMDNEYAQFYRMAPLWRGACLAPDVAYPDIRYFTERIKKDEPFSMCRFQHGDLGRAAILLDNSLGINSPECYDNKSIDLLKLSHALAETHNLHWDTVNHPIRPSVKRFSDMFESLLTTLSDDKNFLVGFSDRSIWLDRCKDLTSIPLGGNDGVGSSSSIPHRRNGIEHFEYHHSGARVKPSQAAPAASHVSKFCDMVNRLYSDSSPRGSRVFASHLIKNWAFSGELTKYFFQQFGDSMFVMVCNERLHGYNVCQRLDLKKHHYILCDAVDAASQHDLVIEEIRDIERKLAKSVPRIFFIFCTSVASRMLICDLQKQRFLSGEKNNSYYLDLGLAMDVYGYGYDRYGHGNCYLDYGDVGIIHPSL